jgi:Protein of unknown function (DUF1194)
MKRAMGLLAAAVLAAPLAVGPAAAPAAPPVELALVLLSDVSGSMDAEEYGMVAAGYRAAFSDPEVIAAIRDSGGAVAVSYVEFSGEHEFTLVRGWDLLTDAASTQAFGEAVAAAARTSAGNTALAASMRQAGRLLEEGGFGDARRVIDIATDHPGDSGRAAGVRDQLVAAGITINALPIFENRIVGTFDGHMTYSGVEWGVGGMAAFYRLDVIGGPGCFMLEARGYEAFAQALKRKLLRELVAQR